MNGRSTVLGVALLLLQSCGDDSEVVGEMASGGSGGGPTATSTGGGSGSGGTAGGSGGTSASSSGGTSASGSGGTSTTTAGSGVTTTAGSGVTTTAGSGGTSTTSAATGSGGAAGECADGEIWCPGCNDDEGDCFPGGCPAAACAECSSIDNEADCEARSGCHPVFEDPGTCGCAAIGCCARFAFCAEGGSADCEGLVTCMPQPYCEAPAFVIAYAGNCYEGCVRPEACAGSAGGSGGTSTTGAGPTSTSTSTSTGSGGAGELCPCEPESCAEDEQMCLQDDECVLSTGPIGNGLCRSADGTCFECECASPDTPIATAHGERLIRDLAVGDLVYSVHDGAIRLVPIRQVNRVPVTQHRVLRIEFASGAHFEMSAGHPTAQGLRLSDLAVGESILGERVTSITEIAYQHPYTYDVLPDSDTGSYFADGVLVGSTLHRRSAKVSSSW